MAIPGSHNLGTDATNPIRSGGKIAGELQPSATTSSVVSDYLSYGSYSGTDIKVVVHYTNWKADQQALSTIRQDTERDLSKIENNILALRNAAFIAHSRQEYLKESLYRDEIAKLENEASGLRDVANNCSEALAKKRALPNTKVLGELQTISWSVFRDKQPVRTLGSIGPRAYTRGTRTIGGSMVFTMFREHVLHEILELDLGFFNTGTSDFDRHRYSTVLPDQLSPLDISIVAANEYGSISHMGLYGVQFVQEGGTFSIEDIFSESVVQYIALDIDPLRISEERAIDSQGVTDEWTNTASQKSAYFNQRTAHLQRRTPFI